MSGSTSNPPYLVVYSIGNPEAEHLFTRHSMGHYAVNRFHENLNCHQWQRSNRLTRCTLAESTEYPITLLKSQTQMNVSGGPVARNWQAIKRIKQAEGYEPVLVVIHDELSVAVGRAQVRLRNASPRGHNGLKSIRSAMGGNFLSIAIGIGRPDTRDQNQISNYVLRRPTREQLEAIMSLAVPQALGFLEDMLDGDYIDDST